MKKVFYIALLCVLAVSCNKSEILDVDQSIVVTQNHHYLSYDDARSALIGTYSLMQDIAAQNVILGDLRADLVDVKTTASPELIELNTLHYDSTNQYILPINYLKIIINCNDGIVNMDEMLKEKLILYSDYTYFIAEFKTLRSWVYLQMSSIYDSVPYIIDPIKKISELNRSKLKMYNRTDLLPILRSDLLPFVNVLTDFNKLLSASSSSSSYFVSSLLIDRNALLGDIYLSMANETSKLYYDSAAYFYFKVISDIRIDRKLTGHLLNSIWIKSFNTSGDFTINSVSKEVVNAIPFYEIRNGAIQSSGLTDIFTNQLSESKTAVKNWESQKSFFSFFKYDFVRYLDYKDKNVALESKYKTYTNQVCLYRTSTIHLRYAEAVNRLGRCDLALIILNGYEYVDYFGYLRIDTITPLRLKNKYPEFKDAKYAFCYGVRGQYYLTPISLNTAFTKSDSILMIENYLAQEMAMETAFEGTRYQDLIRISNHRNSTEFLANAVAQKFADNGNLSTSNDVKAKLQDEKNWYIPMRLFMKH